MRVSGSGAIAMRA